MIQESDLRSHLGDVRRQIGMFEYLSRELDTGPDQSSVDYEYIPPFDPPSTSAVQIASMFYESKDVSRSNVLETLYMHLAAIGLLLEKQEFDFDITDLEKISDFNNIEILNSDFGKPGLYIGYLDFLAISDESYLVLADERLASSQGLSLAALLSSEHVEAIPNMVLGGYRIAQDNVFCFSIDLENKIAKISLVAIDGIGKFIADSKKVWKTPIWTTHDDKL